MTFEVVSYERSCEFLLQNYWWGFLLMAGGIIFVIVIFLKFTAKNTTSSQLPRISRSGLRQMVRQYTRKEQQEPEKVDDIDVEVF